MMTDRSQSVLKVSAARLQGLRPVLTGNEHMKVHAYIRVAGDEKSLRANHDGAKLRDAVVRETKALKDNDAGSSGGTGRLRRYFWKRQPSSSRNKHR